MSTGWRADHTGTSRTLVHGCGREPTSLDLWRSPLLTVRSTRSTPTFWRHHLATRQCRKSTSRTRDGEPFSLIFMRNFRWHVQSVRWFIQARFRNDQKCGETCWACYSGSRPLARDYPCATSSIAPAPSSHPTCSPSTEHIGVHGCIPERDPVVMKCSIERVY